MEPARLLGACKLGSWARMDSRPRGRRKAFYEGSSKEEGGILGNEVYVNELVEMKMVILRRELVKTTTKCQRATAQLQEMDRCAGMEGKQEEDQGQGRGFGADEEQSIPNDHGQEGSGGNDVGVEVVQAGNGRENIRGKREKHVAEAKKAVEALLSEYSLRILEEVFLEIKEVAKGARDVTLGEGRNEASNRMNYDLQEGQAMNNQAGEIPKEKGMWLEDDCQKKDLERNVDEVHLKKRPFSCKEDGCQQKFGQSGDLEKRIDEVHLKRRLFSCREDGCQAKFVSKRNMEGHVDQVHLKKRPFSCTYDHCQQKFGQKGNLALHVDQFHLKKRPFSCNEDGCDKMFARKINLNKHIDTVHLRRRPFSCKEDGCQAKFVSKRNMEEHVDRDHLKKRPFSCTYDGCQQKFVLKGNLVVHVDQVHLKKRPFSCNENGCNKMFARKYRLKDHMRSAHGAPKLVCKKAECSASFVFSTLLYKHMMETH